MRITNPRPGANSRAQAPTRDEVVLGSPGIAGVDIDFGQAPLENPLGAAQPRPGLNDTPLNIRERQDR